jgi:hypothetical protein
MRRLAAAALLALAPLGAGEARGAVVVAGADRARILVPPGVDAAPYENLGYRLRLADRLATIDIELDPIGSSSPFEWPAAGERPPGALERLAVAVTRGSRTRHEAATRLLAWVSGNVRYRLDRAAPQDAEAVLARRSAYCTGFARLTVALLGAVGIEAREVAGYVAEGLPGEGGAGYHRWVEIRYPDRGWAFSDPLASHGFVGAPYLRLESDRISSAGPGRGLVIERQDRTIAVDVAPGTPAVALRLRANRERRNAAALALALESGADAEAELLGAAGLRRLLALPGGRGTFLGLEPGRYELRVREDGQLAAWKSITIRDRVLAEMSIPRAPHVEREGGRKR